VETYMSIPKRFWRGQRRMLSEASTPGVDDGMTSGSGRYRVLSEAIRKLFSNVVPISSSILAVMKCMATTWSKSVQHKMNITDLDHSST